MDVSTDAQTHACTLVLPAGALHHHVPQFPALHLAGKTGGSQAQMKRQFGAMRRLEVFSWPRMLLLFALNQLSVRYLSHMRCRVSVFAAICNSSCETDEKQLQQCANATAVLVDFTEIVWNIMERRMLLDEPPFKNLHLLPPYNWVGLVWSQNSAGFDGVMVASRPHPSRAEIQASAGSQPTTAPVCPHRTEKAPQRSHREVTWTELKREQMRAEG